MLVRLILWAIVLGFAYLLLRRTVSNVRVHSAPRSQPSEPASQLVQDPQCGAYVDRAEAVVRRVPGGTLYFCSERCANAYVQDAKTAT